MPVATADISESLIRAGNTNVFWRPSSLGYAIRTSDKTLTQAQVAMVQNKLHVDIGALGFPFDTFKDYLYGMRLRTTYSLLKRDRLKSISYTRIQLGKIQAQYGIEIFKLWELNSFSKKFVDMLTMGLSLFAVGAAVGGGIAAIIAVTAGAGTAVPGIGTLIGGCVGLIIGIGLALLPFDKWNFIDKFADTFKELPIAVRYMWFAHFRAVSDEARTKESKPIYGPWFMKNGDEFYTIYGGVDAVAFFTFQKLWEMDSLPEPPAQYFSNDPNVGRIADINDKYVRYCVTLCASGAGDGTKLGDVHEYKKCVWDYGDGKQKSPNKWLAPLLYTLRDKTCGQLRTEAIAAGIPDYSTQPVPGWLADQLVAYENSIQNEVN